MEELRNLACNGLHLQLSNKKEKTIKSEALENLINNWYQENVLFDKLDNLALQFKSLGKEAPFSALAENDLRLLKEFVKGLASFLWEKLFSSQVDLPSVYSQEYLFVKYSSLLYLLLSCDDTDVHSKGLNLLENLLIKIKPNKLSKDFLEILKEFSVHEALISIMKFCPEKNLRSQAFKMFKTFFNCMVIQARYLLLLNILSNADHDYQKSVLPLGLNLYKDLFVFEEDIKPLVGGNLFRVIEKCLEICLPKKHLTDVPETFDANCSLLNFIRYLLLRDRREVNETGIWDKISFYEKNYIETLREAIRMSRTQCHAQLSSIEMFNNERNEKKEKIRILNNDENDSSIDPNLTDEEKKESLQRILVNLEMLESVVGRLCEIIVDPREI